MTRTQGGKMKQSKIVKEEEEGEDVSRTKTVSSSTVTAKTNLLGNDWRAYMPLCREVANQMSRKGKLDILQRGNTVDPVKGYKGPIRLRLPLNSPLFE